MSTGKIFPTKPFVLGIIAPRGSGKTTVLVRLMLTPESEGGFMFAFKEIYLFSPNILVDDKLAYLASLLDPNRVFLKFDVNVINKIIDSSQFDNSIHKIIVLDDCISENSFMDQSPDGILNKIATTCRNRNISVIVVLQKFKGAPKTFRENVDSLILFNGFSQTTLSDMYCAEIPFPYFKKSEFIKDYVMNTGEPYSFLVFNRQLNNSLFSYKPSEGKYTLLSNNTFKSEKAIASVESDGSDYESDRDNGLEYYPGDRNTGPSQSPGIESKLESPAPSNSGTNMAPVQEGGTSVTRPIPSVLGPVPNLSFSIEGIDTTASS